MDSMSVLTSVSSSFSCEISCKSSSFRFRMLTRTSRSAWVKSVGAQNRKNKEVSERVGTSCSILQLTRVLLLQAVSSKIHCEEGNGTSSNHVVRCTHSNWNQKYLGLSRQFHHKNCNSGRGAFKLDILPPFSKNWAPKNRVSYKIIVAQYTAFKT